MNKILRSVAFFAAFMTLIPGSAFAAPTTHAPKAFTSKQLVTHLAVFALANLAQIMYDAHKAQAGDAKNVATPASAATKKPAAKAPTGPQPKLTVKQRLAAFWASTRSGTASALASLKIRAQATGRTLALLGKSESYKNYGRDITHIWETEPTRGLTKKQRPLNYAKQVLGRTGSFLKDKKILTVTLAAQIVLGAAYTKKRHDKILADAAAAKLAADAAEAARLKALADAAEAARLRAADAETAKQLAEAQRKQKEDAAQAAKGAEAEKKARIRKNFSKLSNSIKADIRFKAGVATAQAKQAAEDAAAKLKATQEAEAAQRAQKEVADAAEAARVAAEKAKNPDSDVPLHSGSAIQTSGAVHPTGDVGDLDDTRGDSVPHHAHPLSAPKGSRTLHIGDTDGSEGEEEDQTQGHGDGTGTAHSTGGVGGSDNPRAADVPPVTHVLSSGTHKGPSMLHDGDTDNLAGDEDDNNDDQPLDHTPKGTAVAGDGPAADPQHRHIVVPESLANKASAPPAELLVAPQYNPTAPTTRQKIAAKLQTLPFVGSWFGKAPTTGTLAVVHHVPESNAGTGADALPAPVPTDSSELAGGHDDLDSAGQVDDTATEVGHTAAPAHVAPPMYNPIAVTRVKQKGRKPSRYARDLTTGTGVVDTNQEGKEAFEGVQKHHKVTTAPHSTDGWDISGFDDALKQFDDALKQAAQDHQKVIDAELAKIQAHGDELVRATSIAQRSQTSKVAHNDDFLNEGWLDLDNPLHVTHDDVTGDEEVDAALEAPAPAVVPTPTAPDLGNGTGTGVGTAPVAAPSTHEIKRILDFDKLNVADPSKYTEGDFSFAPHPSGDGTLIALKFFPTGTIITHADGSKTQEHWAGVLPATLPDSARRLAKLGKCRSYTKQGESNALDYFTNQGFQPGDFYSFGENWYQLSDALEPRAIPKADVPILEARTKPRPQPAPVVPDTAVPQETSKSWTLRGYTLWGKPKQAKS